jgi:hypothetical protein
MKWSALIAMVVTTLSVAAVGAAKGDGGPVTSPGASVGEPGVYDASRSVRYVALTAERDTVVTAIRAGRVLRWGTLRGGWGFPLVAYDGTTGGLTADGETLVLTVPTGNPGPVSTFPVLSTKDLRKRSVVKLRGSWAFDAVSPDGSILYLVEYYGTGPAAQYRVRAYDLEVRRLLSRPIVDRKIGAKLMRGQPVTRVTTTDGRWAYTLYARQKHEPFVHALDTVNRKAYCIDLPLELSQQRQMQLRLRLLDDGGRLAVRAGAHDVAQVDTETFEVQTGG